MTARTPDPDRRRIIAGAAVALVLLLAMAMAAGCIGSDAKNDQDIHLIKLYPDGSVAWTKVIDSGKDDEVDDIIQTSDGGYVAAGGYSVPLCNQRTHIPTTATLTRISSGGDILWAKNFALNSGVRPINAPEGIIAVYQAPDSGYMVISQYGLIRFFDNNGNIVANRSLSDPRAIQLWFNSVVRTRDNGYLLGGIAVYREGKNNENHTMMVAKLDNHTNLSWLNIYYDSRRPQVSSLIELGNNSGIVGSLRQSDELVLLNHNGTILGYPSENVSGLDDPYKTQAVPDGFVVYQVNKKAGNLVEEIRFNTEGNMRARRILFNITHDETIRSPGSDETLLTSDQQYLTIIPDKFTGRPLDSGRFNVRAQLLTASGSVIWDREILSLSVRYYPGNHVRHIIETGDGGFLVVLGTEKSVGC
jgi:hypothetical protein